MAAFITIGRTPRDGDTNQELVVELTQDQALTENQRAPSSLVTLKDSFIDSYKNNATYIYFHAK